MSETEPNILVTPPGPRAREIIEREKLYASPSLTKEYLFVADHGDGCFVWDPDGNCFLDFHAGIAVGTLGHNHARITQVIAEQAERLLHMCGSDFYHAPYGELCERLSLLAPGETPKRVFLSNSGTGAVECAIKLARFATGRPYTLACYGGFHGRTLGALVHTGSNPLQRKGQVLPAGTFHFPYPDVYRGKGVDALDELPETVFRMVSPKEFAAVIIEPIQGEGGYIVPPPWYMQRLRRLWLAKGIANGLPLGATIARAELMEKWEPGMQGSTGGGNPVACRVALIVLDELERGVMTNCQQVGSFLQGEFRALMARHPSLGDVRGKGLMIGLEIVRNRATKEEAKDIRDTIIQRAFERGLLLLHCGKSVIRISPPLILSEREARIGVDILDRVLTEVEQEFHVRLPQW
ncbi:aminotransferase class III-fold pyridoxal phosphate-dependent enzyme [Candidatus Peregrinibacteria bacterium]|nr:aminotransferase class III-fold pyridoxal phosphate-dependent enzyme [Candidatus Peregrinibacteria bacterium]